MNKVEEEIGKGLLDRLNSLDDLKVLFEIPNDRLALYKWTFQIDEFNISVSQSNGPARICGVPVSSDGGFSYKLHIDDVKINLRYRLAKKICKRVDYLLNKPDIDKEEEHSNFIKKDAHINFAKRK